MLVLELIGSIVEGVAALQFWLDTRFDLADVLHFKGTLSAGVLLVGTAHFHGNTEALPTPPTPPTPPVREMIVDIAASQDGFFTTFVRCAETGDLIVMGPAVSTMDGSLAAARHMYNTSNLILPEPAHAEPVCDLVDRTVVRGLLARARCGDNELS